MQKNVDVIKDDDFKLLIEYAKMIIKEKEVKNKNN